MHSEIGVVLGTWRTATDGSTNTGVRCRGMNGAPVDSTFTLSYTK